MANSLSTNAGLLAQAIAADVKALLARSPPTTGGTGLFLQKTATATPVWATVPGVMPIAGAVGQVFKKTSTSNYTGAWTTIGEVPIAGTTGQVLAKTSATNFATAWVTPAWVPAGGAIGAVLRKTAATDYATEWAAPAYVPAGGAIGTVLKKNSATDFDASWAVMVSVPSGGGAGQVLTKSAAADHALSWTSLAGLPAGGATGQIPVKTAGGYGWTDPPPGVGTFAVPPGGATGMQLVKLSATDGDVGWAAPAGSGTGSGSTTTKVTRGFTSAIVSNDPDPLNSVGLAYLIRKEGPASVVNYDAVKPDALSSPASSIPNLTMLRCGRPAWQNISLMLGSIVAGVMPKYLRKLQAGAWKGVTRFTLENAGSAWGNFFVGVVAGNEAISGALRGWQFIDGSQYGNAAMAGIGFEFGDEMVQFVWSFNDEAGTQKVPTTMNRSALLSEIHEARFELNAERTHLSATLVHIPSGNVVIGPQLLPLAGGTLGYTMSIGRGASAFDGNDYDDKYVGVASMTMETAY